MRFTLAAVAALLSVPVLAAPAANPKLEAYAKQALPRCPDTVVTVTLTNAAAPAGFVDYQVAAEGKDPNCSTKKHLLYSPSSNQVILGNVIPLPADGRPLNARLSDYATQVMKKDIVATAMPFPLPDGVKLATLTKQTDYGPFAYHVYVDASEKYMMIGMRGNLNEKPGKTLLDSIGMADAMRRGNQKAKIEIVELSDFECPACGNAHKTIWPTIEKNLSKISFARLDFPLFEHHEWALPAALGARAVQKVAPAKYWEYEDFMFGNQEMIGRQPFDQVLKNWVTDHDIDWAKIEPIYHSEAERQALMQQVERIFDTGINATPTFILNGQQLSFGPDGVWALAEIRKALGLPAAKPAAKKK